ncbi:MAG: UvrB/UvrC motif-containing protein [bacterium]
MLICQSCLKAEASILAIVISGSTTDNLLLCTDCAKKKGINVDELNQSNGFMRFVTVNNNNELCGTEGQDIVNHNLSNNSNLFFYELDGEEDYYDDMDDLMECTNCGLTFDDFELSGKLGCPECYAVFYDSLVDDIRRIHGSNIHCGSFYFNKRLSKRFISKKIEYLQGMMNDALEQESFEQAAKLRDKIKTYETLCR